MKRYAFLTIVSGGFSDTMHKNNYNPNRKKTLGFRNLQENLENIMSVWNIAWYLICAQSIRHESMLKNEWNHISQKIPQISMQAANEMSS